MSENQILALLRLQNIPHIGSVTAKKLIAFCGSPTAVFSAERQALMGIEGIGTHCLMELYHNQYLEAAKREFQYIQRNNIAVYSYLDPDYPAYLKHCQDGPILLFTRGLHNWNHQKILSVVGTRHCTNRGIAFCREIIKGLLPYNPLIVSGMAYGIDISIQREAAEQGLQTIGCLAHGLDTMYPPAHALIASKIEAHGAMITEFWSGTIPERENFLRRNRIIAGISEATLVIESARKGGSLVTADMASGYNRDVFAVPGRPNDPYSEGCNNLIKHHKAQLITSAADLITMLNWDVKPRKQIQKELFPTLYDEEKEVYNYLLKQGKRQLDQIAAACSLPLFKVTSTLLKLEMKELVRPLPGKYFEIL